jgi:hypothetical protein
MLPQNAQRVSLAVGHTDMRKAINGLSIMIEQSPSGSDQSNMLKIYCIVKNYFKNRVNNPLFEAKIEHIGKRQWPDRANRHFVPGQVWHLTHRCHKREFLLKFGKDSHRWLQWLYKAKKRYGLVILNL